MNFKATKQDKNERTHISLVVFLHELLTKWRYFVISADADFTPTFGYLFPTLLMFSVKFLAQSVKKIVLFEQIFAFFRHSLKYFYIIPNLVCAVVRVLILSVSNITADMVAGS